jgi:hypothetical protein
MITGAIEERNSIVRFWVGAANYIVRASVALWSQIG